MGLVYSRAVEVVVWVGEEADDSAIAMSEIGSIRSKKYPETVDSESTLFG